jgi:hypothetical protein
VQYIFGEVDFVVAFHLGHLQRRGVGVWIIPDKLSTSSRSMEEHSGSKQKNNKWDEYLRKRSLANCQYLQKFTGLIIQRGIYKRQEMNEQHLQYNSWRDKERNIFARRQ